MDNNNFKNSLINIIVDSTNISPEEKKSLIEKVSNLKENPKSNSQIDFKTTFYGLGIARQFLELLKLFGLEELFDVFNLDDSNEDD